MGAYNGRTPYEIESIKMRNRATQMAKQRLANMYPTLYADLVAEAKEQLLKTSEYPLLSARSNSHQQ